MGKSIFDRFLVLFVHWASYTVFAAKDRSTRLAIRRNYLFFRPSLKAKRGARIVVLLTGLPRSFCIIAVAVAIEGGAIRRGLVGPVAGRVPLAAHGRYTPASILLTGFRLFPEFRGGKLEPAI